MSDSISSNNKFLIIVAGPTAVGKTNVSLSLAESFLSEIFSADSRQLYKETTIGTAKPSVEQLNKVKHHFINHLSIFDEYSVGHYEKEIDFLFKEYFENNDVAIVCGGTGLYLRAILEGLDDFPDIPSTIAMNLNHQFELFGINWLQNELLIKDPEYYQSVDLSNPRRILRALSVIETSGVKYSSLLQNKKDKALPFKVIQILLELPREELYQRINQRVETMLMEGILEEAKNLYEFRKYRSLQTVGYQELFEYIEKKHSLTEAVELIKQNSRRYAKRQMTWFRKYGEWNVFNPNDINSIKLFIESKLQE